MSMRYWDPLEMPHMRQRIEVRGTPVANIDARLIELQHSLDSYPADAPVPWNIAQLFNGLLIEVEKGWLEDPLVQAIIRAEIYNEPDVANVSAGEMRAAVAQLLMVVDLEPPRNMALEYYKFEAKIANAGEARDEDE